MPLSFGENISPKADKGVIARHVIDDELGVIGGFWAEPDTLPGIDGKAARFGFAVGPVRGVLPDAADVRGTGRGTEVVQACMTLLFVSFDVLWVGFPRQPEYASALHIVKKLGFTPYANPRVRFLGLQGAPDVLARKKW